MTIELLYFSAPWCGPCRMIAPIFNDLEKVYGDRIKFIKVNIDDEEDMVKDYNIRAVPTFVLQSDLGEAWRSVGMVNKATFIAEFKKLDVEV